MFPLSFFWCFRFISSCTSSCFPSAGHLLKLFFEHHPLLAKLSPSLFINYSSIIVCMFVKGSSNSRVHYLNHLVCLVKGFEYLISFVSWSQLSWHLSTTNAFKTTFLANHIKKHTHMHKTISRLPLSLTTWTSKTYKANLACKNNNKTSQECHQLWHVDCDIYHDTNFWNQQEYAREENFANLYFYSKSGWSSLEREVRLNFKHIIMYIGKPTIWKCI